MIQNNSPPSHPLWWKATTVYQIFPISFKDTNGDGIGDLAGIIERLDYLQDLGVETIWLNPIFSSPFKDAGYDISDYKSINHILGNMSTCERLIKEVHEREMKIIFDLVLNHTSDEHPWFKESCSSRDNPKRDWYVWRDGKKTIGIRKPPNNWRSLLSGKTGWHYHPERDQWYWAHFFKFQPDLNYWNPKVREAMLDVMRFWLDKGIDGYRLDFINGLFCDKEFRDNPFKFKLLPSSLAPEMLFQDSKFTLNRPQTLWFMKVLRALVDEYDPPRFLVGETTTSPKMLKKYCGEDKWDGLHTIFLFPSLGVPLERGPLHHMIKEYEQVFPDPYIPTWVFSTHDRMRRITRLLNDLVKAKLNAVLQFTARGIPFIYYGEEIGLTQPFYPTKHSYDPVARNYFWIPTEFLKFARKYYGESVNRDECRTPMQWDDSPHAGFCPPHAKPWNPLSPKASIINVKKELPDPNSLLNCYKTLLTIRKKYQVLQAGDFAFIEEETIPEDVLGYRRFFKNNKDYSELNVFLNLSESPIQFNSPREYVECIYSTMKDTQPIQDNMISMYPFEAMILTCKN